MNISIKFDEEKIKEVNVSDAVSCSYARDLMSVYIYGSELYDNCEESDDENNDDYCLGNNDNFFNFCEVKNTGTDNKSN